MKILLADDHGLLLAGVRKALEADGFEIVGEAAADPRCFRSSGESRPMSSCSISACRGWTG